MTTNKQTISAGSICFGLNREIDESSIKALCQRFSRESLLNTLIPRLSDQELHELADTLFAPMKKYFSKEEYHLLFINEQEMDEEHGSNP